MSITNKGGLVWRRVLTDQTVLIPYIGFPFLINNLLPLSNDHPPTSASPSTKSCPDYPSSRQLYALSNRQPRSQQLPMKNTRLAFPPSQPFEALDLSTIQAGKLAVNAGHGVSALARLKSSTVMSDNGNGLSEAFACIPSLRKLRLYGEYKFFAHWPVANAVSGVKNLWFSASQREVDGYSQKRLGQLLDHIPGLKEFACYSFYGNDRDTKPLSAPDVMELLTVHARETLEHFQL
ncbi:hypothetical protein MMC21_006609 [Puttea exsequens]|nr:hypothetical protein [Puttea exsequens]